MAESTRARKITETESKIEVVQIDGLVSHSFRHPHKTILRPFYDLLSQVVMKLIKHCHEVDQANNGGLAQGALLGLVDTSDTKLEITHAFPFPNGADETVDDEDFQMNFMQRLRMVKVRGRT